MKEEIKDVKNIRKKWENFKIKIGNKAREIEKRTRKKMNKLKNENEWNATKIKRTKNWCDKIIKGGALARLQDVKREMKIIREIKIGRNNKCGKLMKEMRVTNEKHKETNEKIEKIKKVLRWKDMKKKEKKRVYLIREAMIIKEKLEMIEVKIDKERTMKAINNLTKIDEEEELYRLIHDDKCTRQFFAKIKSRNKKEDIVELRRNDEEKKTKDEKKMKKIMKEFYSDLWKKRKIVKDSQAKLLATMKKRIKNNERIKIETDLKEEEVKKCIKLLKNNKEPGIDGITAEFYKSFVSVIPCLTSVLKQVVKLGSLSGTQKTAVVQVIFKKKDRTLLKFYRPISLLCVDYKILAKIIAERIKPTLKYVIHQDQQGYVINGDIRGNIYLVKEVMEYYNETGEEAVLVLLDGEKAYDRQDHDFMIQLLEHIGYSGFTLEAIKAMYNKVEARIVLIGEMTDPITIEGGVRQGCPLSCYLYIFMVETLAERIWSDPKIIGVTEPETNIKTKVSLFADDTSGLLVGMESVQALREVIRTFEQATGAKLNDDKTFMIALGGMRIKTENLDLKSLGINFDFMPEEDRERYRGDLIGNDLKQDEAMEQSLHKLRAASFKWRNVDTTILGRTIIANAVLLSKILYRGSINVASERLLRSITKAMEAFIWKKNFMTFKSPIAWKRMVQPRIKGGAGALDPRCAVDASRIKWIKRLLKQEKVKEYPPWKAWMLRRITAFKRTNSIEGDVWNHRILLNQKIKFQENLAEDCVRLWWKIRSITPWYEGIRYEIKVEGKPITIEKLTSKIVYQVLLCKKYGKNKILRREEKLKKCRLNSYEKEFWFKYRNGYFYFNARIKYICKKRIGICPLCRLEKETTKHHFEDCEELKAFRNHIEPLFKQGPGDGGWKKWWNLEDETMTDVGRETIAKLVYQWYQERCRMNTSKAMYCRKKSFERVIKEWKKSLDRLRSPI